LLQPLLNQSLVPLLRTMQRLLAGNAELRQKPPNRHRAQDDMEQLRDHLACPQRKRELQLQRVFLRHSGVNPPQLLAVELRRASRQGLRLQTIPAATPVSHQPSVYGRPVDTKNTSDDLWTFAIMNTLHRAHAHLFQRLMIQLSRVVFSHAGTESIPVHAVKQNIELLMNGLIAADIGLEHMTNLLCHDMQAQSLQGMMRVAPWSKAVTAIEEISFKHSLENARDRPLQQPVSDSGNPQWSRSDLARPFGYLDPPNRRRAVRAFF